MKMGFWICLNKIITVRRELKIRASYNASSLAHECMVVRFNEWTSLTIQLNHELKTGLYPWMGEWGEAVLQIPWLFCNNFVWWVQFGKRSSCFGQIFKRFPRSKNVLKTTIQNGRFASIKFFFITGNHFWFIVQVLFF